MLGSQSRSPQTPHRSCFTFTPFSVFRVREQAGTVPRAALTPSQLPGWDLAEAWPRIPDASWRQALQLPGDSICIAIQEQTAPLHGKSFLSDKRARMGLFLFLTRRGEMNLADVPEIPGESDSQRR